MSIQGSLLSAGGAVANAAIRSQVQERLEADKLDRQTAQEEKKAALDEQKKRDEKYINRGHAAYGQLLEETRTSDPKAYQNLISRQEEAMSIVDDYISGAEFQRQSMNARIQALQEKGLMKEAKDLDDQGKLQAEEYYQSFQERLNTLKKRKYVKNGKHKK